MFTEPYQTTILAAYQNTAKKLTHQLETGYIQGELHPAEFNDEGPLNGVLELVPGHLEVEPMVAPKLINTNDGIKVVFDARANKRMRPGQPVTIVNPSDYYFSRREAVLLQLWTTDGPERLSSLDALPIRVYARWLADGIARRLDLNALDRLRVEIIAAYFYVSQLRKPVELGADAETLRHYGFANLIARALTANLAMVVDTITPLGSMANENGQVDIHGLVAALKGDSSNVRMAAINPGLIYTMLNGSWFGARSSFVVGVALEFPPTFLAMLYTAITDRSHHKSYFARTVQQADRAGQSRDVVVAMNHLSRGLTDG